jgi:hypothetical protein
MFEDIYDDILAFCPSKIISAENGLILSHHSIILKAGLR